MNQTSLRKTFKGEKEEPILRGHISGWFCHLWWRRASTTWTQRSSRWWKARRGDTWTQNLLRWQDQEPIPQTVYKLVLANLWIQVFLDITCSHQWSPIQSANACRCKYFTFKSEDKSEWIELDSTSECKLLRRKDLYSKVCQYKTLWTVHRIDTLSILGNTYNN